MLQNFVEYVYSFYGADDALYPMGVTKQTFMEQLTIISTQLPN